MQILRVGTEGPNCNYGKLNSLKKVRETHAEGTTHLAEKSEKEEKREQARARGGVGLRLDLLRPLAGLSFGRSLA